MIGVRSPSFCTSLETLTDEFAQRPDSTSMRSRSRLYNKMHREERVCCVLGIIFCCKYYFPHCKMLHRP